MRGDGGEKKGMRVLTVKCELELAARSSSVVADTVGVGVRWGPNETQNLRVIAQRGVVGASFVVEAR